jgi:hypothetical protein
MAGFEVSINGRIWVSTEAEHEGVGAKRRSPFEDRRDPSV